MIAGLLLQYGADPNFPNKDQHTPMNIAVGKNDSRMIQLMRNAQSPVCTVWDISETESAKMKNQNFHINPRIEVIYQINE